MLLMAAGARINHTISTLHQLHHRHRNRRNGTGAAHLHSDNSDVQIAEVSHYYCHSTVTTNHKIFKSGFKFLAAKAAQQVVLYVSVLVSY